MSGQTIYCCGCQADVASRLTDGREIYPHRPDLHALPFWICDGCGNNVGCHHKTKDRTRPLGVIATKRIKAIRMAIHAVIDPVWRSGRLSRQDVYSALSKEMRRQYHTAAIKTTAEGENMLAAAKRLFA